MEILVNNNKRKSIYYHKQDSNVPTSAPKNLDRILSNMEGKVMTESAISKSWVH